MLPADYQYNQENATVVGDGDMPAHGVQLNSVDVGSAKYGETYVSYKQDTSQSYSLEHLQEGNMVKVGYQKRRVKTPYRVAFLQVDDKPRPDKHRGDNWKNQDFKMVLEPFNSRASTLLLCGIRKYNSEKQFTEWTTRQSDDVHSTEVLITRITSGERSVEKMMRRIGDRINKFHDIKILSDISIVQLLDIKDPELLPMII